MLKSTNNVEKNVYELEITIDGEKDGINFRLVSADYLDFCPLFISK